jgi:hypothetical protein
VPGSSSRLQLDVGDERSEHDPGAEAPRDQERVLAIEADPGAGRSLAVDVLVRIHEHAIAAAEAAAESVQLLAQLLVGVVPRVARQAPAARLRRRSRCVVAESGGHDRARSGQQRLRMA